jgi:hypothetical protein
MGVKRKSEGKSENKASMDSGRNHEGACQSRPALLTAEDTAGGQQLNDEIRTADTVPPLLVPSAFADERCWLPITPFFVEVMTQRFFFCSTGCCVLRTRGLLQTYNDM